MLCAAEKISATVVVPEDEPPLVREAFRRAARALARVEAYRAAFVVELESLKGSIIITGMIAQQPPFAFRREAWMEERNGTTRKRELTVCDGTNGWQIEYAPNGKVLTASRWTRQAMEELFYVFAQNSQLLMLTHDRTNTYLGIRRLVRFERVQALRGGWELWGHERPETPAYQEVLRVAEAYGAEGISNYVAQEVRLTISAEGIPVRYERVNAYGRPIERMVLDEVRVNPVLPGGFFQAVVPTGVMVMDLDRALDAQELRLRHALLGSNAPPLRVQYSSGKQVEFKPGTQPMVATFFLTINPESRAFVRALDKVYQAHNTKVKFVTIAVGVDSKGLARYARAAQLTLPLYCDEKREAARAYLIRTLPCALVLDACGVVVDAINASAPEAIATLEERLRTL
ncbi:MAG: peroxiredoxin family protein [bacterium]|nr:peroxiredoxin family protein [bacterium]